MDLKILFNNLFNKSNQRRLLVKFSLSMSLIVLLFLLSIFPGLMINNKKMIETEILARARSHFDNILVARRWNAMYGGVYIEKTDGIESNPYLKNPDIETINGKIYTKRNPALMTREISELADVNSDYQFHITSLDPINPSNRPDEFEALSLNAFEDDVKEMFQREKIGENVYYRYMGPLVTEQSCLQCHSEQGYREGDIRGGISIKFRIDDIDKILQFNRNIIIALTISTSVALLGMFYFLIFRLNKNLEKALLQIKNLADKDILTGLYNRRYLFQWTEIEWSRAIRNRYSLSVLMLDIDYFKRVNEKTININMTASLGLSTCDFSDEEKNKSIEKLIDLADRAMYQAKKNGRTRIETL
ncbi:MAG: DUF3365 domain-containing protein [Spirochaetaceae bacterium]|jgi:hypothetical protein|nr:DUF3365 domain-containing protein [Spirochaetaceae bacterium]